MLAPANDDASMLHAPAVSLQRRRRAEQTLARRHGRAARRRPRRARPAARRRRLARPGPARRHRRAAAAWLRPGRPRLARSAGPVPVPGRSAAARRGPAAGRRCGMSGPARQPSTLPRRCDQLVIRIDRISTAPITTMVASPLTPVERQAVLQQPGSGPARARCRGSCRVPPKIEVPPSTTAVMTSSSRPVPMSERVVETRRRRSRRRAPAMKPEQA